MNFRVFAKKDADPGTASAVAEPVVSQSEATAAAEVKNEVAIVNGQSIPVMRNVDDVFNRVINAKQAITAITFKRTLTRPLTSISHAKEILLRVTAELYQYDLPVKGRSEKMQPATILEGTDLETGEEIMLVCNAMMTSALTRAGFPLAGRCFAFKEQGIKADKNYRVVDVVEVEVS